MWQRKWLGLSSMLHWGKVRDMFVYLFETVLLFLVIAGSATIVWGVRHVHLSSRMLALTFAVTAASWVALLVLAISFTVKVFVFPNV
jgi:hypothetical protein